MQEARIEEEWVLVKNKRQSERPEARIKPGGVGASI